ncbi:MAG: glycosyltransferase [Deltaproteobacteria bacterium]|nr:glycosyltransferase [Deltaproteobacteria bacterium]
MVALNRLDSSPKVAFVLRGITKYRLPLYRRLKERGNVSFHIFCQQFDLPAERVGFSQPSSTDGLPITWLKAENWTVDFVGRFGVSTPSLRMLPELMRYRPDVIVFEGLSNIGNDLICMPYVYLRKIPFIWWSLGAIPERKKSLRSRCGDAIQSWYLKRAGAAFAYSSYGKKILEQLGATSDRTFVVYNTLDEKAILEMIEQCRPLVPELRHHLKISHQPVAVFSGTINRGKRLDVLIKSFAIVRQTMRSQDPRLIVIGDGEDLPRCQDIARKLDLSKTVHFVGRQEELASAYFLIGQVAALPGLGGLAINHAFTHGLPVICGKADGCEIDLVQNDKTGIRLKEMTVSSLANSLCGMFKDHSLAHQMGKNAHKLITTKITMDNYALKIESAIKTALETSK